MRDKHWHVAVGHPDGAAYAVSEYSDPGTAVRDFMKLSSIYTGRIDDPVAFENTILSRSNEEDFCVMLGMDQPMMIVCTVCDCEFLTQVN